MCPVLCSFLLYTPDRLKFISDLYILPVAPICWCVSLPRNLYLVREVKVDVQMLCLNAISFFCLKHIYSLDKFVDHSGCYRFEISMRQGAFRETGASFFYPEGRTYSPPAKQAVVFLPSVGPCALHKASAGCFSRGGRQYRSVSLPSLSVRLADGL